MGCFKSETKWELPKHLKGPTTAVANAAQGILGKGFTPYTGDRVAEMSGTQSDAMAKLRSMLGMDGGGPAPLPRVIDNIPGAGPLAGSTQDYMDPFLEQVLAPMLREINLGVDYGLQKNDASAHMAGAFGDTGHGTERAKTMAEGANARGDATGRVYSAAYNDAMNRKSGDIDRMMTDRNATIAMLKDLFNMGGVETGLDQANLDALFEEFMRKEGFDFQKLAAAASALGSIPTGQMSKTPSTVSSALGGLSTAASLFI